jgi:hypothetical protein
MGGCRYFVIHLGDAYLRVFQHIGVIVLKAEPAAPYGRLGLFHLTKNQH